MQCRPRAADLQLEHRFQRPVPKERRQGVAGFPCEINIFRSDFQKMENRQTPFQALLGKILPRIEIIGLLMIAVGFAWLHFGRDSGVGGRITMIGFTTFAVVCYLYAFLPQRPAAEPSETAPNA